MVNGKKIIRICAISTKRIFTNSRFYLAVLWAMIVFSFNIFGIRVFCVLTQARVAPWIFPLLTKESGNQMFLILGALLLFCDAPFLSPNSQWQILRAGRKGWFWGNILYIFFTALCYTLLLAVLPILICIPYVGWSEEWGKVLGTLAQTTAAARLQLKPFDYRILLYHSPQGAMLLTILSVWLNVVLIGMVNYTLNLWVRKGIGTAVSVMLGLSPLLITRLLDMTLGYYLSPPLWMSLAYYKWGEYGIGVPVGYAYGVLIGLILFCIAVSWIGVKKKDLIFQEEV